MRARKESKESLIGAVVHRLMVSLGAGGLTLLFFLVLPLMQSLQQPPDTDLIVQAMDTAVLEAPPPPVEEEPEEEPEQEEEPPELIEEAPPLDLSQLELALNPTFADGLAEGDFAVKLNSTIGEAGNVDSLFSITDLDQKPRVMFQPSPVLTPEIRKKAPGSVSIVFVVDQQGKVENPVVQHSTDPAFEKPALAAVKQWKFEAGRRDGQPVRFRMRVPITFPKG
jgi:protein TonB